MSAGPMLSAWYPLTVASEARPAGMSWALLSGAPNSPLTAQAAAAALAALLPMPLPSGRPCCVTRHVRVDGVLVGGWVGAWMKTNECM